jgi:hypothetical protein
MFTWRTALLLGVFFIVVAAIYWFGFYNWWPEGTDYTGFLLLGVLGIAMTFGFLVLIRNSREL